MIKKIAILASLLLMVACQQKTEEKVQLASNTNETKETPMKTLHDYQAKTLDGDDYDFSQLEGKRVLIVNTASECGYTPQYGQLQELYENYGGEDFVIIGFPSNDFGGQEPGSNGEIAQFCSQNYGVSFPMMAKTPVKGADQHPVYKWLTSKDMNGKENVEVQWNFNKFLVDEHGSWIAYYPSGTSPLDEKIVAFAGGK
ncbi:MAG: glutathione peroxidase [Owenweeksia sp.]